MCGGSLLCLTWSSYAMTYEVYKCVDARGQVEFRDLPCKPGQRGQILDFKKQQKKPLDWQRQVQQSEIEGAELLEISQQGGDFIVSYTFMSNKASNEFMRVLRQYSGMNVNLQSVSFRQDGLREGEAKLTPQG